jgi:hypothetical protein
MNFNLKFVAIIVSLILIMFAVAYVAAPGRSRLAIPSATAATPTYSTASAAE